MVAQQYVGEHLGRRTRTVADPETSAHVAALREQQRQFVHLLQLATSLATQLEHVVRTQRRLGDALGELSQSGGDVPLGEQFSSTSDTLKLVSKNGDTLLSMLLKCAAVQLLMFVSTVFAVTGTSFIALLPYFCLSITSRLIHRKHHTILLYSSQANVTVTLCPHNSSDNG